MKRLVSFWKIILFDTLGVFFMIAALATGWLPGPGGVPLFLIGLSLLAINHVWAEKYIVLLKNYANKIGELVFIKNSKIQLLYDLVAPILFAIGIYAVVSKPSIWVFSLGVFCIFLGSTMFLGNRGRWHKIRNILR